MRVLVVDDTRSVRAFVTDMLRRLGVKDVVQAEDGAKALSCLENDKNFDMIFMDWEMPVMTGPEAIFSLKSQGVQIPIVMMTTKNTVEDIERMLNMGAQDYLMKPFTMDILADKIRMAIGKDMGYAA